MRPSALTRCSPTGRSFRARRSVVVSGRRDEPFAGRSARERECFVFSDSWPVNCDDLIVPFIAPARRKLRSRTRLTFCNRRAKRPAVPGTHFAFAFDSEKALVTAKTEICLYYEVR